MALEARRRVDPLALLHDQVDGRVGRRHVHDREDVDLIFDRHEHLLIGIAREEIGQLVDGGLDLIVQLLDAPRVDRLLLQEVRAGELQVGGPDPARVLQRAEAPPGDGIARGLQRVIPRALGAHEAADGRQVEPFEDERDVARHHLLLLLRRRPLGGQVLSQVVVGLAGDVLPPVIGIGADSRQQAVDESEMLHLLPGHHEQRRAPTADGLVLRRAAPLVRTLLHGKACVEVLHHELLLDLRRLVESGHELRLGLDGALDCHRVPPLHSCRGSVFSPTIQILDQRVRSRPLFLQAL